MRARRERSPLASYLLAALSACAPSGKADRNVSSTLYGNARAASSIPHSDARGASSIPHGDARAASSIPHSDDRAASSIPHSDARAASSASLSGVLTPGPDAPPSGGFSATKPRDPTPSTPANRVRDWPPTAPGVATDWCIGSVDALDEATCYVLPEARPTELLIYLHGIVPPSGSSVQKTNVETVVANASRRAGVAALIPRGVQGLGPAGQESWWGWPTGETSYRARGPALVRTIAETRARFERFTGNTFERVYLAGSSSGAYFVSELALHGGLCADGYAAMAGGAGRVTPEAGARSPTPFYIGFGVHDATGPSARALGISLEHAGWPVRIEPHAVPHGAHEIYLDEAFAFWREHSRAAGPCASDAHGP